MVTGDESTKLCLSEEDFGRFMKTLNVSSEHAALYSLAFVALRCLDSEIFINIIKTNYLCFPTICVLILWCMQNPLTQTNIKVSMI